MFMRPQRTRRGVNGCPLHIAVSVAPDFLESIRGFGVRIVSRNFTGSGNVNHFAEMRVKRLRPRLLAVALTGGDE